MISLSRPDRTGQDFDLRRLERRALHLSDGYHFHSDWTASGEGMEKLGSEN
jgi:hypothetical protein